jgi:protein-tyrosine phosphatase
MKRAWRVVLLLVLLTSLAAVFWLWKLADGYREEPYTEIEEGLYVGASVPEPPPNTKAVLNLCDAPDRYKVESCMTEVIVDGHKSPGVDWLRKVVGFVDAQRKEGKTTYIHCNAGVSRSGLVITAYIMHEHHWGRDRALAFVRSKRPQIQPNPTFMQLLSEWEEALKQ